MIAAPQTVIELRFAQSSQGAARFARRDSSSCPDNLDRMKSRLETKLSRARGIATLVMSKLGGVGPLLALVAPRRLLTSRTAREPCRSNGRCSGWIDIESERRPEPPPGRTKSSRHDARYFFLALAMRHGHDHRSTRAVAGRVRVLDDDTVELPVPAPARSALTSALRAPVISQSGAVLPSPPPSTGSLLAIDVISQDTAGSQRSDTTGWADASSFRVKRRLTDANLRSCQRNSICLAIEGRPFLPRLGCKSRSSFRLAPKGSLAPQPGQLSVAAS